MNKTATVISILIGVGVLAFASGLLYWTVGDSPASLLSQARVLSETDKLEALELVRSSIRASKGDFAAAQFFECELLLDLKRGRTADRAFEVIRHPELIDPEALCRLAEKAHFVGEEGLASRAYFAAGEFVQGNPVHLKRLFFALYSQLDQNSEDQILKLCQDYSQRWPNDPYPWIMRAALYSERNVLDLAIESLREALKRGPPEEETCQFRISLAQMSMILGDVRTAREQCDLLLASNLDEKSRHMLPVLLADVYLRERKPSEALDVLNKLPESRSASADIKALRGRCLYELEDYVGAIADLKDAIRLNEFDQQSHYIIGQAYLRVKDEPMAKQHLNRSSELNEIISQILTVESQLRNDLNNRQLKLKLAELNEKRGEREKAAAWRRGARRAK